MKRIVIAAMAGYLLAAATLSAEPTSIEKRMNNLEARMTRLEDPCRIQYAAQMAVCGPVTPGVY